MKRFLSMMALALFACIATMAANVKKTNLKVLYVGGHSDIETFGTRDYDKEANAKSIVARTAAWKSFLETYFTTVKAVQGKDYNYKMSYDYDVTIIDGDPTPITPRRSIIENGRYGKLIPAKYFPENFDRPVITIADESETTGRYIGVKNDWYCLCLLGHAYNMQAKNAIFKGPYKVKITTENRPTPAGAKEYAEMCQQKLPNMLPMWKVQNKDYGNTKGYKVGMVTRQWGYLDSPDAEIISGGESAKSYGAIAIGRHANFLHWGFSASPADMTEEAKPVFLNAVIYINKFKGHHIIARKLNEGIATRSTVDEHKYTVSKENYDAYKESIEAFNKENKHMADSLKKVVAAGKKIGEMEQMYMQMAENPQPVPSYIDYVKERAGKLYEKFGTDVDAYVKYYTENRPYFYGDLNGYDVTLDEDAKSLGIANNDKRILDKAITLWESNQDVEKAKRILYHYTLLRYENAKEWRNWYNKYQSKLFFTESGGWLWLVNDLAPKTPGNDYSILKYYDFDESKIAPITEKATQEEPVALSSAVSTVGANKEIIIRMKIYPGYHIYAKVSDQDPYIQTTYDLKAEGDAKLIGELQKPAGRSMAGSKSIILDGEQIFRQKVEGRNGKITFTINYQACDNHACLMPKNKTITIEL